MSVAHRIDGRTEEQVGNRSIRYQTLMTTDEHVPLRPTFQKLEMSLTYISNKSLTHPGQSLGGTQNWWTNRRTSRKPINQISGGQTYYFKIINGKVLQQWPNTHDYLHIANNPDYNRLCINEIHLPIHEGFLGRISSSEGTPGFLSVQQIYGLLTYHMALGKSSGALKPSPCPSGPE